MWPQSFAVRYGEKSPGQVFCQQNPLVLLLSWWQVYQLSWWQTVFFHTKRTTCWIDANQPPILALRSYKNRPCEGCYFLPSRVCMFGYSRVFFLVCAWIFHKCTVCKCNINMSIFDCMSWFFNLNIRATLHTFVLCNLLFWSKSLWIELAWNACILESTTKTVVNTEECFSPCNFSMHLSLLLANVHGCQRRVSTGVRSFDENRKQWIRRIGISLLKISIS